MPPRGLVRSFVVLWWVLGATLLVLSVRTVIDGWGGSDPHPVLIGGLEVVAAVLFLIPRTLRAGAAGLLFTIAIATALHFHAGHFRWDLLVYAAAVLFVAVHGPLTGAQWRHAVARPVNA
jgi:hypothetical protein